MDPSCSHIMHLASNVTPDVFDSNPPHTMPHPMANAQPASHPPPNSTLPFPTSTQLSNQTLLEVRDPRTVAVTCISAVLAIVVFGVSLQVYWRRRTWFYAAAAVAIVPLLVAHVATFLASSKVIHTNTFLIIRMLCPILTTSQVCSLSLYRYWTLASTGQLPRWFTRRTFLALLCVINAEMLSTIVLLGISFTHQDSQPYFTRHPWRWVSLLVHMAVTCTLDFVVAVLTFRAVWLIRAGVLLASNEDGMTGSEGRERLASMDGSVVSTVRAMVARSAAATHAHAHAPPSRSNSATALHDSMSTSTSQSINTTVPSPVLLTRRVSKSAPDAMAADVAVSPLAVPLRAASLWTPQESPMSECFSHASTNFKPSVMVEPGVLESAGKQPTSLRVVTLKLLVLLFSMMVALVSGLVLFTALDGRLFAASLSNLMIHVYLLPATLSWSLLAELTRATTI